MTASRQSSCASTDLTPTPKLAIDLYSKVDAGVDLPMDDSQSLLKMEMILTSKDYKYTEGRLIAGPSLHMLTQYMMNTTQNKYHD